MHGRALGSPQSSEEYSHTDPLNQRGNRHNTYDDETYQRSDLPHRGRPHCKTEGTRQPSAKQTVARCLPDTGPYGPIPRRST